MDKWLIRRERNCIGKDTGFTAESDEEKTEDDK